MIKLNNGVEIPQIGYGVYQIPPEITKECVLNALRAGYRHIDTAYAYRNEKQVGEALKESGLKREEVFITTKIYNGQSFLDACEKIELALKTLAVDYIDLMLIHWPEGDNLGMYRAMEKYYREGKLRAIGLSNFYDDELDNILKHAEIPPAVDQIETHPFRNQKEMQKILSTHQIVLESWSPLAAGRNNIFNNPTLSNIARKHKKSVAQVILRYLYERDIIIIPRSKNENRIKENIDILDFALDKKDIEEIESLNTDKTVFPWG